MKYAFGVLAVWLFLAATLDSAGLIFTFSTSAWCFLLANSVPAEVPLTSRKHSAQGIK